MNLQRMLCILGLHRWSRWIASIYAPYELRHCTERSCTAYAIRSYNQGRAK